MTGGNSNEHEHEPLVKIYQTLHSYCFESCFYCPCFHSNNVDADGHLLRSCLTPTSENFDL